MSGKMRHVFGLSLCLIIAAWANLSWAGASGEWLSLGIGRGNTTAKVTNEMLDDPAILLAGSVLRDSHIWSLRYSRVGLELSRGDVALLYERVLSRRSALVSVGAGVGLLYRDSVGEIESEFFNEAGVAWTAQVTTGSRSDIGLGLQGFGSISGDGSFWGVALVVQFGERGADHGVPFDVDAVTCVYFRYSFDEGTQVVVRDARQIDRIMDALRLKAAQQSCCDFVESVQFTVAGENHVALVSGSQFELTGRHRAHFVMAEPFYAIMQAYRDSSRLREPWDGKSGDALK